MRNRLAKKQNGRRRKKLFKNLEAEMVLARVTGGELAKELGMSESTFSTKRNSRDSRGFTLEQALAIKKRLRSKLTLEKLFEWED